MSIEAVVAYWEHAGPSEHQDADQAVANAAASGFHFDADELRRAHLVRGLLGSALRDEALREELSVAEAPTSLLLEKARRSGEDIDPEDVVAVLAAVGTDRGELSGEELERVAGGTTTYKTESGDELLVAFLSGDVRRPYILGSMWNTGDQPPTSG